MKKLFPLLFILLCLHSANIQAQITAKNSIYVELLGNAGLYSFNYDRIVHQRETFKMSIRGGLSYVPLSSDRDFQILIPLEWNVMLGRKNKYFETGIGLTQILYFEDKRWEPSSTLSYNILMIVPRIGYRLQKDEKGFLFRIGLTPLWGVSYNGEKRKSVVGFFPSLGISLGKSF